MTDQIADRMARRSDLTGGALRGTTGPLAKVPLSDAVVLTKIAGAGSAGAGSRTEQQDGGAVFYSLTTVNPGTPNAAALGTVFRGSTFGIRSRISGSTTQGALDLVVDGRCVAVAETTKPTVNGLVDGTTFTDWETSFLFPYALKADARHTGYAVVGPNPDGATVTQVPLNGWLFSRADGYRDSSPTPRKGRLGAVFTVPTAATASFSQDYSTLTGALRFKSTDASARTVTIYRETGTTAADVYDILTIPANAGSGTVPAYIYALARPTNLFNWKIKVDTGTTVTAWEELA